ncbi:MAG: ATP-binding protein [Verrucomicrobiota bacterium]
MTVRAQLLRSHIRVLRIGLLVLFLGLVLLRSVELRLNLVESLRQAANFTTRSQNLLEPGTLKTFYQGKSTIQSAALVDLEGNIVASFPSSIAWVPENPNPSLAGFQRLFCPVVTQQIRQENGFSGSLILRGSFAHMGWQLAISVGIFVGLSTISLGLAIAVAERAVVPMLKPIQRLANAALKVGIRQDYSVRVPVEGNNEWAQLAHSFNAMLIKIESQTREVSGAAERFDLAVSGSEAGIWDWDLKGDQLFLSDRFKELLGFTPEDLPGSFEVWEYLHLPDEEDSLTIRESLEQHARENIDVFKRYCRLRNQEGTPLWFEIRGKAYRPGLDAPPHRMAGSITLVQDRKEAEEKLRRSLAELQEFAYIASHDLREPLRTVASYVSLLKRRYGEKLDPEADEFIEFAVDGTKRMKDLIDDLLAYSQAGTSELELNEVDAQEAFGNAIANLGNAIEDKSADISAQPLPKVLADKTQLTQVFQNLLANAIKFTNGSQPQVRVEANEVNGKWQFSVRDNGIGIAPEHQDRIFKIFRRLHLREDYEGTGIGLSVTQKIIERHGGQIWVSSLAGEGATFFFTLDKAESENSPLESAIAGITNEEFSN